MDCDLRQLYADRLYNCYLGGEMDCDLRQLYADRLYNYYLGDEMDCDLRPANHSRWCDWQSFHVH